MLVVICLHEWSFWRKRVCVLVLKSMMPLAGRRSMSLQLTSITTQMQSQALKQASLACTMSKSTIMLQQSLMQSMHHCQLQS